MEHLIPDNVLYLFTGLLGIIGGLFSFLAAPITGTNTILLALKIVSALCILLGTTTILQYTLIKPLKHRYQTNKNN